MSVTLEIILQEVPLLFKHHYRSVTDTTIVLVVLSTAPIVLSVTCWVNHRKVIRCHWLVVVINCLVKFVECFLLLLLLLLVYLLSEVDVKDNAKDD